MGLISFLKSIFTGSTRRDISRLGPQTHSTEGYNPQDFVGTEETVDLSGGPLKEHHKRRELRDRRLLPKHKVRQSFGLKKKRLFAREEADRLFSRTLLTRNRNIRDLLTDEEQLKRYGLPVWQSEEDLARALGISLKELRFFSIHREKERQPHYIMFAIKKRNGGKRVIMAPKRRLKAIQRRLLSLLVEKLPVSDHAHGFRKGRNVRSGAEAHVGRKVVLKMDLKHFFPAVTFARVRGLLIAYGYSYTVASVLAVIMTEAERQPVKVKDELFHVPVGPRHCVQGAPTSPGLCNALVLRLDRRLAGVARKRGFAYTRYADDLTFSADADKKGANALRIVTSKIVESEGFRVNLEKTRIMGTGARQTVTNVVVNQVLGMSRQDRRKMRAAAHRLKQKAEGGWSDSQLSGKIAYLRMLNQEQADKVAARM